MVDALREADPMGLRAKAERVDSGGELGGVASGLLGKLLDRLTLVKVPGTAAWAAMGVDERTRWWAHRVGRFTALLTAIPGLGGALADRLPVQDALGAAAQGLLLVAIAGEHGVLEPGDRVRLVAWVLFDREIAPEVAAGSVATAAESTEAEPAKQPGKATLKSSIGTLWRLGRSLLGLAGELEKRPRGRFYHRVLGMLPVIGMAGDYLGERSGLKRVARRAEKWFARHADVG